ncbi:hypothetical protein [Streptomyces sp. NPDC056661]|uniref:hypothetical protein n=1 Tax=Streptomyces sp. NPDC056661 TaxID=3345898 RepID=UPI0036BE231D
MPDDPDAVFDVAGSVGVVAGIADKQQGEGRPGGGVIGGLSEVISLDSFVGPPPRGAPFDLGDEAAPELGRVDDICAPAGDVPLLPFHAAWWKERADVLVEVALEVLLVPGDNGALGVLARRPEVGDALTVEVGLGVEPVVEETQDAPAGGK